MEPSRSRVEGLDVDDGMTARAREVDDDDIRPLERRVDAPPLLAVASRALSTRLYDVSIKHLVGWEDRPEHGEDDLLNGMMEDRGQPHAARTCTKVRVRGPRVLLAAPMADEGRRRRAQQQRRPMLHPNAAGDEVSEATAVLVLARRSRAEPSTSARHREVACLSTPAVSRHREDEVKPHRRGVRSHLRRKASPCGSGVGAQRRKRLGGDAEACGAKLLKHGADAMTGLQTRLVHDRLVQVMGTP